MKNTIERSDYYFSEDLTISSFLTPIILQICQGIDAKKILDIGCGNGSITRSLYQNGYSIVGLDQSENGIDVCKEVMPNAKFYNSSVYDDPDLVLENEFDVAISTEVIEHLYYPRYLPRFAKKKLKKGGLLIVSTPYHGYLKNLLISLLNKWDSHHTCLWDDGHIKFWSVNTLKELVESEGFKFNRFYGCGRISFLWKNMVITATKL